MLLINKELHTPKFSEAVIELKFDEDVGCTLNYGGHNGNTVCCWKGNHGSAFCC